MTKRILTTFVLAVTLSFVSLATPQVVATHSVLGELVKIIGGDLIEVVTIIPSGFCPGHYDLSPSDYATLIDADLVLYSGIEPWVEQLGDATKEGALVQFSGSWNTPTAAAEKATAIATALSERIPEGAEIFSTNRDAYIVQLEAAGLALSERATALGVSDIPVVCMQWQASFVSWLGFNVAVTYGLPEGLSMRDLVDLTAAGVAADAELVIDNLQSGIEFGGKLAREIGAVHVVLSNFPGALPKTATIIDLFVRNAEALFTAIEPIE
jgi:hypothetical protein